MPGLKIQTHPTVIATLSPGYAPLFERVLSVTESDERIRALWLSGSLARGVSDAGSDLDLIIAVGDADFEDFAATWRDWLASITPTLIARQFGQVFTGFHSLTTDFLRLDGVVEKAGETGDSPHRRRLVVFDRDRLDEQVPAAAPQPGPDPERIAKLVEEYFRVSAIFPAAVLARRDWLLGVEGVHSGQVALYQLFVESNQPLPPMGVKQWSSRLRNRQRELLLSLAVPQPELESLCTTMMATHEAFRTAGRAAAERCGVSWPVGLDDAVTGYLRAELPGY